MTTYKPLISHLFSAASFAAFWEIALMKLKQWWDTASRYVGGAVRRIFGPSDDDYPKTGAQSFEGSVPKKRDREH